MGESVVVVRVVEELSFGFLSPEFGTHRLSRNIGKKLPALALDPSR